MRIDFSEPECSCSTCFHYRTSGILNTQETEPSNVIGSSVPFRFGPFQVLGHDSAAVGSTSTSSQVHSSSPIRFGTTTPYAPAAISSVSSGPANFDSGVFGCPTPSTFESTQAPAFGSGLFGAPTPSGFGSTQAPAFGCGAFGSGIFGAPTPSRSVSTEPKQSLGLNIFGSGVSAAPKPSMFGSMQAPVQASASTINTSSTSSLFNSSSPFGSASAVPSVSTEPTQSLGPNLGFGVSAAPKPSILGSMQAPVQASASTTNTSSPFHSSSPITVSTEPTQSLGRSMFGSGASAAPTPSLFGSMQAPVQASSASATSTSFSFGPVQDFGKTASVSPFGNGVAFARPDVGFLPPTSKQSTSSIVFGTTPVSVPSLFGPAQDFPKTTSVCASSTPKNPFSSYLPGFGVSYLPGSSSNGFGGNPSTSTPVCGGGGSVSAALKSSSPQPFGFNAATTTLSPSYCSSSSAAFSGIPNFGTRLFASREWSRPTEEGSRHPRYAPTPDFGTPNIGRNGHLMISISASDSYLHKSHEELRWEDYKQGDKGGLFPAAHISPVGSRPNAVFSPSTVSPSICASRSIFDHPERTTHGNMTGSDFGSFPADATTSSSSGFGQTNVAFNGFGSLFPSSSSTSSTTIPAAPISSNVQRPHETTDVSSPASGCTACGATSSPSASGYSAFNGATIPPSAATSLPGLFFSTSGSCPMMFGTTTLAAQGTTPAIQAYPMMFGTTLVGQGANLPVQVTTPAIHASPVQGFILLPFAAMSLQ